MDPRGPRAIVLPGMIRASITHNIGILTGRGMEVGEIIRCDIGGPLVVWVVVAALLALKIRDAVVARHRPKPLGQRL